MTTADPAASLAQLHQQVTALLSRIDTAILPAPTRVYRRPDRYQAREWTAGRGWLVYVLDTPDDTGFVYLDHACEDINYRWGEPGDWEALRAEQARQIGLALLAAAHHAEQTRTVTPLTTTEVDRVLIERFGDGPLREVLVTATPDQHTSGGDLP